MLKSQILIKFHFLALLCALIPSISYGDTSYPNHSVRLVIPFATGGSNDIVGRFIADQLSKRLGETFVVDNRGGAGGTIGSDSVAKSKPDGYTLLLISTPHTANSSLYKKLPYHPIKDFVPIARIGSAPQVISVYPGLPVKTLPELIAYAKARPGQVNFVSSGIGSSQHLVTEMFASQAELQLVHVPYKGAGAALADVAAGHAQISVGTVVQGLPLIKGDRLRPLAVSGNKRQPVLLDVPTASEMGLKGYDADNWWGILAPAGTPPEVIQKLSTTLAEILSKPETIKKLSEESATVAYLGPDEFAKFMETESQKWAQLIKKLNIKPE
jgi:tripartite-type tricarboxylate transporter receptor subunit TctC